MHETDFSHEHAETAADRAAIARTIWAQDNLVFTTVGIDIGSSTSHLLFAKLILQRQSQLSSRFVVTGREIVYRSPIMLTPFLADGLIDAAALGEFIARCYRNAGFSQAAIDSGAVILTGEAIKRKNARAIDELFAAQAGKFVCASAGHKLEARLAAHGSGAVALSKSRGMCVLHVDVGGGTTKLALIDRGTIVGLAAFAAGGRLIATDGSGAWTRIDESARRIADHLSLKLSPSTLADEVMRRRIVQRLAVTATDIILDAPLDALAQSFLLTEPLPRKAAPAALTFSGGVAEYIFGHERAAFGDIAKPLADELAGELSRRSGLPLVDPGQRIRATAIGASQFTVQVSGKTIYLPDPYVLPVRNVPVVHITMDAGHLDRERIAAELRSGLEEIGLDDFGHLAIAFSWPGDPEHAWLSAAGAAILTALRPLQDGVKLLVLAIDGDIGKTFGQLLHRELQWPGKIVCIDGVELHELDYIDVGELIAPPGVVPVVIKSLLFA
ncbi:MAG: ethanolamine ammonia-lyase reactivating factor EutA [Xanthobacteraceae bacterium]|jgi:ethanolamine utilization protein EutA